MTTVSRRPARGGSSLISAYAGRRRASVGPARARPRRGASPAPRRPGTPGRRRGPLRSRSPPGRRGAWAGRVPRGRPPPTSHARVRSDPGSFRGRVRRTDEPAAGTGGSPGAARPRGRGPLDCSAGRAGSGRGVAVDAGPGDGPEVAVSTPPRCTRRWRSRGCARCTPRPIPRRPGGDPVGTTGTQETPGRTIRDPFLSSRLRARARRLICWR